MDWEPKATPALDGPQKHRIPKLLKNHEEPEADISMQKLLTLSKTRIFPQLHNVKGSFI